MLNAALYRTEITHARFTPVRHGFRYRGYSWYVDVDQLPRLRRPLRWFADFQPRDHFSATGAVATDTLRARVDACLAARGLGPPLGKVTALLQARVLGHVFNPLSLYWCHDREGLVRHIIAEVHNTYGGRHAYVFEPGSGGEATVAKEFYVSPFNPVDGHYEIRAPEPEGALDISVVLHRGGTAVFAAAMRGARRKATVAELVRLQFVAPFAPLAGALRIRSQGIAIWLRRVPVAPR